MSGMVDAALMPVWREFAAHHEMHRKELDVSSCRGCGAEILWVTTENDKNMPMDADPGLGPKGEIPRYRKERVEGSKRIVHRLRDSELEANTAPLYCSHFETCPDKDSFRRT